MNSQQNIFILEIEQLNLQENDKIFFKLKNGEEHEAVAIHYEDSGMLFMFSQTLNELYQMNICFPWQGYGQSELRCFLNNEILALFPDILRSQMLPVFDQDLLRIPSVTEIFGKPYIGEDDSSVLEKFETSVFDKTLDWNVATERNGFKHNMQEYWLINNHRYHDDFMCTCNEDGEIDRSIQNIELGVRLIFKLSMEDKLIWRKKN